MTTQWDALARGIDCPFCAPRPDSTDHWDFVAKLSISSLYLNGNQTYHGHCQLVFDPRHANRPDELKADEWASFSRDLYVAQDAIVRTVRPDHINLESLGNVVPHLHWHIVPRYKTDPRWGAPVWLSALAEMGDTALPTADREALISALRAAVGA